VPSVRDARPRPQACLNCGSTRVDAYCASCGQRNVDMRIPARDLALDAVEDGLSLDSRVARTLVPFLFRPGFLTVEWSRGRRARFSSPLRLYLLTSFVFFLATGLAESVEPTVNLEGPDAEAAVGEIRKGLDEASASGGLKVAVAGSPETFDLTTGGSEEQHARLRARGWLGRVLDDRWRAFGKMSRQEILTRVKTAFREWVPRVMFFLVPAAVLILALLWRRRWLSEHVVLALHLHAFAFTVFTLLLVLHLLPWPGPGKVASPLLWAWLGAYFLLALRRVYGQGWRRTVAKAGVAALLYVVALAAGMVGIAALALYFA